MTNFSGVSSDSFGLTADLTNRVYDADVTANAMEGMEQGEYTPSFAGLGALQTPAGGSFSSGFTAAVLGASYEGHYTKKYNAAEEWFEIIHVRPPSISLGNVLSTVLVDIDIFNADRYMPHILQDFINNAGDGITITDLPTLPYQIPILTGLALTLEVTPDGPPTIDGTLDFDFDLSFVSIPITGTRIVLFPYPPEKEIVEWLRFLTQVIEKKDGREQRIRMRKNPRQEFHMRVKSEGRERQKMHSLLYDWQGRVFGLPIWTEPSYLTSAVTAGGSTLPVDSTRYADFRDGGLLVVFKDYLYNDTLPIDTVSSTSITLASPLGKDFGPGTRVMPIRNAVLGPQLQGSRKKVRMGDLVLRFMVLDNDANLADNAAFPTLAGKVLLSDYNIVDGDFPEILARRLYVSDNEVGTPLQTSIWDRQRRGSQKGFLTRTRQEQWELKQLLYYLNGRLNSVYLPTFYDDMIPNATLTSGSPAMSIENIGYTTFVQDKKDRIRVHLKDGTIYDRTIIDSSEVDEDTETLTLNTTWPANILHTDVDHVEYVETVRFDTDDMEIVHYDAFGQSKLNVPVVEVLFE